MKLMDQVRARLRELGYSQNELAEDAGISRNTAMKLIKPKSAKAVDCHIRSDMLEKVLELLGSPTLDFGDYKPKRSDRSPGRPTKKG